MDDFLNEKKSLDELHSELVLELDRLRSSAPENLTFSDADVIIYILDLYFDAVDQSYAYLKETPRLQILTRLKRNLDDQLKLMDNRADPDINLWYAAVNLATRYLDRQNSHVIA